MFHIGDAPPHGKEYGCNSSDKDWTEYGCPCKIKKEDIGNALRKKEINYYLIMCSSTLNLMKTLFEGAFGERFKQAVNLTDHSSL